MKIIEKLNKKQDIFGGKSVTIAFLGDSVTQGCFENYIMTDGGINTRFEYKNSYAARVGQILNILYPFVQVNIINSGISGDNALNGARRFDRDIAPYSPDLIVVSYGLNDCTYGKDNVDKYVSALEEIFEKAKGTGAEIVFLTQNYMATRTSIKMREPALIKLSEEFAGLQNDGTLKFYFENAKELCKKSGVPVCDLYSLWERMALAGTDTTELLANKLNHPIKEMHYYTAIKLVETMYEN